MGARHANTQATKRTVGARHANTQATKRTVGARHTYVRQPATKSAPKTLQAMQETILKRQRITQSLKLQKVLSQSKSAW